MATTVGATRTPKPAAVNGTSSPARRLGNARWRDPRLAIGILLVAGSLVLGVRVVAAADDTVAVWSLRTDLTAGSPVSEDDLTVSRVHFSDAGEAELYLSAAATVPSGAVVAHDVVGGELLTMSALQTPAMVTTAELPIAVSNGSLPADLAAGDHVAVWVAPEAGADGGGTAVEVLDDVAVISLDAAGTALGGTDASRVLLALDSDDADALADTLATLASGSPVLVRVRPSGS